MDTQDPLNALNADNSLDSDDSANSHEPFGESDEGHSPSADFDCGDNYSQGKVNSHYYFHEIIPVNYQLPDQLYEWSDVLNSRPSGKASLGLPLSLLNPFVKALSPWSEWKDKGFRAEIGIDGTVLPGYLRKSESEEIVIKVTPKILEDIRENYSISTPTDKKLKITAEGIKSLQDRGFHRIHRSDEDLTVTLIYADSEQSANRFRKYKSNKKLDSKIDIPSNGTFSLNSLPHIPYEEFLKIFLSDQRSGDYFIQILSKTEYNTYAKKLTDSSFDEQFLLIKQSEQFQDTYNRIENEYRLARPKSPPQYKIAVMTQYVQSWDLQGYSQGKLLGDIALYPNETRTIEVVNWEKRKIENSRSFNSEYNNGIVSSTNSSISSDIKSSLAESLTTNAGVSGGASVPLDGGASVNANGNFSMTSQIDSSLEATVNRIHDTTLEVSENYRMTHEVKIIETEESGSEEKTTRVLKNINQGQVLTFKHYEVSAVYSVTTKRKGQNKLCLLVKTPELGPFDLETIMAFEDRLIRSLLSERYIPGFEATKKLAAQRWFTKRSELRAEQEEVNRKNASISEGTPVQETSKIEKKGIFATAEKVRFILQRFVDIEDNAGSILETFTAPFLAPFDSSIPMPSGRDLSNAEEELRLLSYWIKLKSAFPGFDTKARDYLNAVKESTFNDIKNKDMIALELSYLVDCFGENWAYHVKMVAISAVLAAAMLFAINPLIVVLWGTILVPALTPIFLIDSNNGLPDAMDDALTQLAKYNQLQEVNTLSAVPDIPVESDRASTRNSNVGQLPKGLAKVPRLYDDQTLAEAQSDFEKLVLHLEANRTYYQNEIWRQENSSERLNRLTELGVAPYISSRIEGFSGDYMAFALRLEALPENVKDDLLDSVPFETTTDFRINESVQLPTAGVRVKSILEPCNTLEDHLVEQRKITNDMRRAELKHMQQLAEADSVS